MTNNAGESNNSAADNPRASLEKRLQGIASQQFIIQPRPEHAPIPLSSAQERLWFLDQLEPNSTINNRPWALRLEGPLNPLALEKSLNEIVQRHEVLRTTITTIEELPHQIIQAFQSSELRKIDLRGVSAAKRENEAKKIAQGEALRPFDLTQDSMLRPLLIQMEDTNHILLLTTHHIAFDGWSERILFRQLTQHYESVLNGTAHSYAPLRIQYADYAVWESAQKNSESELRLNSFWKEELRGAPHVINLTENASRPINLPFKGGVQSFDLPPELAKALRELSRKNNSTLFMSLVTVLNILLHLNSGESDLLVGTTVAGRKHRELEDVLGFFINTIVLRTDLSENPTFSEVLGKVRDTSLRAYDHQDLPFGKLVSLINPPRSPDHHPLVQITVQLRNYPKLEANLARLEVTEFQFEPRYANFDISFGFEEKQTGLTCNVLYNANLFGEARIRQFITQFRSIAELAVANPKAHLEQFTQIQSKKRIATKYHELSQQSNLTGTQLFVWTAQKFHPHSPLFNIPYLFEIHRSLDLETFRQSFQQIIDKSDALRTIILEETGVPRQLVKDEMPFEIRFKDFSRSDNARSEAEIWCREQTLLLFDLSDRLFDSALIKLSEEHWIWFLQLHHVITDFSGVHMIFRSLQAFYASALDDSFSDEVQLRPYRDYIAEERKNRHSLQSITAENYWQKKLEKLATPLRFYGIEDSKKTTSSRRIVLELGKQRTQKLKSLASQQRFFTKSGNATLLNILAGLVFSFLNRTTGNRELSLGVAFHNRPTEEYRETIGLFLELLPFRITLDEEETFSSLIKKVNVEAMETLQHRHFSVRNPIQRQAYEVNLNFQTVTFPSFLDSAIEFSQIHTGHNEDMLAIQVHDFQQSGSFSINFDFRIAVFNAEDQKRSLRYFETILDAFLDNPDQLIRQIDLLSPDEKQNILGAPDVAERDGTVIFDQFEKQVLKSPLNTAVAFSDKSITYAELNEKANQVAHRLRAHSVQPDDLVGLYIDRSIDMIIGLLGILKAGAAYLPIDPSFPVRRIDFILQDSGAKIVLTHTSLKSNFAEKELTVLCLDDWGNFSSDGIENPSKIVGPENLAYAIYTSGSTGKPKGVMIEHHALVNFTQWARKDWALEEQDRVLQFTSLSWDAHIEEIFPTLSSGATIVLRTPEMIDTFARFLDRCHDWRISVMDLPTSYWHELTRAIIADQLPLPPTLRLVLIGGEKASRTRVQEWKTLINPQIRLLNGYGLSETTSIATQFDFADEEKIYSGEVPIGRPIENVEVYVLDRHMNLVPRGLTGEVWIGGAGLARGYINRPQLNSSRFAANPFRDSPSTRIFKTGDHARQLADGNLQFVGRADQQVKIRGYRIELGEIEAELSNHPSVREVAVLARDESIHKTSSDTNEKRLVAYVVFKSNNQSDLSRPELQDFLRSKLPDFMVPGIYVMLDKLPITATGKIDRQALPDPDDQTLALDSSFRAPSNDVERRLAGIWEAVIGVKPIGVMDNFFDLGGHSLLAVRLFSVIEKEIGVTLPLMTLFESPTIAHQAKYLRGELSDEQSYWVVEIARTGTNPPFFCISPSVIDIITYRDLSRNMGPDQPFYALYSDRLGVWQKGQEYLEDIASEFVTKIRAIAPRGPIILGGYSAGGHIALAIAQQLKREGDPAALVILFDTFGPNYPVPLPWVTPGIFRALRLIRRIDSYFWKFRILDWDEKIKYLQLPKVQSWLFDRYGEAKKSGTGISLHAKIFDSAIRSKSHFKQYAGDALLVRAKKGMLGIRKDPAMGWNTVFTGNFDVSMVPGNHEDILFGPRSEIVAEQLNKRIAEALT